jgi:hypothetical protein
MLNPESVDQDGDVVTVKFTDEHADQSLSIVLQKTDAKRLGNMLLHNVKGDHEL